MSRESLPESQITQRCWGPFRRQGLGMCKKCGSGIFLATYLAPAPAATQKLVLCKCPTLVWELLLLKTHHYIWHKAYLSDMFDLENETQQCHSNCSLMLSQRPEVILKTGAGNDLETLKTFKSTGIYQIRFASVEILVGSPTVEKLYGKI